eukprot:453630-Rhodomonas_salina.2
MGLPADGVAADDGALTCSQMLAECDWLPRPCGQLRPAVGPFFRILPSWVRCWHAVGDGP